MLMTGSQAVREILRHEGVEYVFGIPGATEVYFMDALEDAPDIKYILGLHEVVAAGMAEGYARTSGKVGVLNLHTGTGLSAALPMLSNAYTGGVPLIVTAGQQDTRLQAYEPHLTANLVQIAAPFSKWATEIIHARDIPTVFRRAFRVATHPPTGPVFISLPQDTMNSPLDFDYDRGAPPFTRIHPDPESLNVAAQLLSRAQNPVLIVQDGVARNEALGEVVTLAELLGARVYQPWMGDVNFPVNHPLYRGDLDVSSPQARNILKKVDVLVVIGCQLFAQVIFSPEPVLSRDTRIIQIDDNPREIGKNYPVASGLEGNIKSSLADLISLLQSGMELQAREAARARMMAAGDEKRREETAFAGKALREKDCIPVSPYRLMQEIKNNLKPGTRIVDDCWSCSALLRYTLGFSEPKSYQRSRNGGSIGWGLPGALGVKLASPDRPVVCVSGDGSAMWSIQSLWTAAHYNLPVTFIICANRSYQQVRIMKTAIMGEKARGRYLGTDISHPTLDFCKIAEGAGIQAQKVDRPEQLENALREAFNLERPNLVEVQISGTL